MSIALQSKRQYLLYWCAIIIYFLFGEFGISIVRWVARVCSLPTVDRFIVANNYAGGNLIVYAFFTLAICVVFFSDIKQTIFTFIKTDKKTILKNFVYYTLGIGTVAWIFQIILTFITLRFGVLSLNEENITQSGSQARWIWITTMVILTPIVEEWIFRYILFGSIRWKNLWIAYSVSSILFGFIHTYQYILYAGDFTQIIATIPYVVMGFGFCSIYKKTENLCYPLVFHMILNVVSLMFV